MSATRIRGQEIELLLIIDGSVVENLTNFRSFEVAPKLELQEEGYLGQATNQYDEIFNGVRGRAELHIEDETIFEVWDSIIARAKRRQPGTQINIKATLNFPNGDRPRILITDAYFGETPLNFASRSDYGTVGLEFSASDVQRI